MKYVEVVADAGSTDTISAIAEKSKVEDLRLGPVDGDGMRRIRMLVPDDALQSVLDRLQSVLGAQPTARILVMAVEVALPKPNGDRRERETSAGAPREALYEGVEKSTRLDLNFLVLVVLSTLVAAIGMIENNVAVVIGAMVIAPLLGPNLALGLGTALGDIALVKQAAVTLLAGILLSVALSAGIALLTPGDLSTPDLLARTEVGLDSVALALASGAAAALSLTTGLSSVLVGVMVAVALLPPAATLGIMLGQGQIGHAVGAALLLAVNIVSVNLATKLVFLAKRIGPRTGIEKERAKRETVVYIAGWVLTLGALVAVILARRSFEQFAF